MPVEIAEHAEQRIAPGQRVEPLRRFAVGPDRLVDRPDRREHPREPEPGQPILDPGRHRRGGADGVRLPGRAKLAQHPGELGARHRLGLLGQLGERAVGGIRAGQIDGQQPLGLRPLAARDERVVHQVDAVAAHGKRPELERRAVRRRGQRFAQDLVAGGQSELVAGGDQHRLPDQLAGQDAVLQEGLVAGAVLGHRRAQGHHAPGLARALPLAGRRRADDDQPRPRRRRAECRRRQLLVQLRRPGGRGRHRSPGRAVGGVGRGRRCVDLVGDGRRGGILGPIRFPVPAARDE